MRLFSSGSRAPAVVRFRRFRVMWRLARSRPRIRTADLRAFTSSEKEQRWARLLARLPRISRRLSHKILKVCLLFCYVFCILFFCIFLKPIFCYFFLSLSIVFSNYLAAKRTALNDILRANAHSQSSSIERAVEVLAGVQENAVSNAISQASLLFVVNRISFCS